MSQAQDDYDSPWKEAIHRFFPDFLQFFYPQVHQDIDWSVPHRFLDQELRKVTRNSVQGNRRLDALIEVQSLSRGAQWLLIHLEIQSQHDAKLEARMLLYNARARDHFQRTVASFVILADSSKSWRPTSFHDTIWDCSLKLEFMMRKLIDYPDLPQMPHNPFSWLVAAHHQAKQTKRNPNQRKQAKLRLLKGLLLCGLDRDKIEELLRLVHWLLALPPDLEYICEQEILAFEEDHQVRYMMLCEKRGHQQGLEEGRGLGLEEGRGLGLEEGRGLGLEEGRGLGLEEGRGLGLEEGLEKGAQQTKRQIALNLIKEGVSPELIFKATGLRVEDLQYTGSARQTSQESQ